MAITIDQQRILADYYLTKKGVSRVLARKPESCIHQDGLILSVLDDNRPKTSMSSQEEEDWGNHEPNSYGY